MLPRRAPGFWYTNSAISNALLPFSKVYSWLGRLRRSAYQQRRRAITWPQAAVIVIGNISVGGTGKTPLVIWTANRAAHLGYRPGVVLRGYGGRLRGPTLVNQDSPASDVGDEAVLIARQTGLPVAIAAHRAAAAGLLIDQAGCDLIISDDGLQHYAMGRDVEIAVVDATRGHGNARCLPAGPLREPVERLQAVDGVICNGPAIDTTMGQFRMQLEGIYCLASNEPAGLRPGTVHAVAGIGNPQRFFDGLRELGFSVIPHAFGDHHVFKARDFSGMSDSPIIMTEKDAVKCQNLSIGHAYYLRANAVPDTVTQAQIDRWLAIAMQRFREREDRQ